MKNEEKKPWATKDTKTLTEEFIDHIYDKYYNSYTEDSYRYEKLNNRLFTSITLIGFLVTILLGIKEILISKTDFPFLERLFTIVAFILPSVSSLLLLYWTQKGYKRKEELREDARIECKYIVNEARIRFSKIKDNPDELEILYKWLNEQIRQLQLSQAKNYFSVHNIIDKTTQATNQQDKEM
ncbi:MAG: hypothetical protein HYZ44_14680 [Bacteroidetes bacterium]|nr:hypothetical protein [Bacteroidota bacterium]